jgi:hypothetical protein
MRSGGDQDRDVLEPYVGKLRQERFDRLAPRLGACDVADRDRDALSGPDELLDGGRPIGARMASTSVR